MNLAMTSKFARRSVGALSLFALAACVGNVSAQDAQNTGQKLKPASPASLKNSSEYYQLDDDPPPKLKHHELPFEALPTPQRQDQPQRDPTVADVDLRALLNTPANQPRLHRQLPEIKLRARMAMNGGATIGILEIANQRYLVDRGKIINAATAEGLPLTVHIAKFSASEVVLEIKELDQTIQLR